MILIQTQAILKVVQMLPLTVLFSSFLHHHSSKLVKSSWNLHNYPSLSPNFEKWSLHHTGPMSASNIKLHAYKYIQSL